MGPVDAPIAREAMLEFYLGALNEVIGPEGTITVFTATYSLGQSGKPFIRETTPSELGAFSEYIRTRPGSVRSIHPLASVAGIGPGAQSVCGGPHRGGFSYASPWGRLHSLNATILSIGIGLDQPGGTSMIHYVEQIYGVPYRYTKLLSVPVISEGREVPGPFTFPARYLETEAENWTIPFKKELVREGTAKWVQCGQAGIFAVGAESFVSTALAELDRNPWCFLRSAPKFEPGIRPFDGLFEGSERSERVG